MARSCPGGPLGRASVASSRTRPSRKERRFRCHETEGPCLVRAIPARANPACDNPARANPTAVLRSIKRCVADLKERHPDIDLLIGMSHTGQRAWSLVHSSAHCARLHEGRVGCWAGLQSRLKGLAASVASGDLGVGGGELRASGQAGSPALAALHDCPSRHRALANFSPPHALAPRCAARVHI